MTRLSAEDSEKLQRTLARFMLRTCYYCGNFLGPRFQGNCAEDGSDEKLYHIECHIKYLSDV